MTATDTIAALATPAQAAPAAVVRASGPACDMLLRVLAQRNLDRRTALDATLRLAPGDVPARVWAFKGPASTTGEDVVEFRIPGQPLLVNALLYRLHDLGVRDARPGEFTLRALRAGKLDLSRAEAVMALIAAQDDGARRDALRDLSGGSAETIRDIAARMRELSARFELAFDFAEDDPHPPDLQSLAASSLVLADELQALAARPQPPRTGLPRVALFGPPNAGKSALFNALLGKPRALVSPLAGTTRDTVRAQMTFGQCTLELEDLSGVGASDLDRGRFAAGARRAAKQADVLLLVCGPDQADALACEFRALCADDAALRGRSLWIYSMTDIAAPPAANPPGLVQFAVSALSGAGLEHLRTGLEARVREIARGGPQSRLKSCAAEAAAALRLAASPDVPAEALAGAVRRALRTLDEALFAEVPGDVLDLIFSRFCIGK